MKKGNFYLFALLLLLTFSCSNSFEQNDEKNEKSFEVSKTEGDPTGTETKEKWCIKDNTFDRCN